MLHVHLLCKVSGGTVTPALPCQPSKPISCRRLEWELTMCIVWKGGRSEGSVDMHASARSRYAECDSLDASRSKLSRVPAMPIACMICSKGARGISRRCARKLHQATAWRPCGCS